MLEKKLMKSIEAHKEEAFALNEYLFNHPEISGEEYGSCKKIVEVLNKYDIKAEEKFFGIDTAFFGRVVEKKDSNINIAICTEYDALPEVGHACGHSASAAISVLAALALKDNEDIVNANVDIIGTPNEEDVGMKIPMADGGVFDKYDCAIMVHLDTKNIPNWRMLAFETYELEFTGKPSHAAASPWNGRSALDGLMLSIHAFDMMRKCAKPHTIIEGFIQKGGVATNIISEKARGKYTFRSDSAKYVKDELVPWARDAVNGCAMATQTKVEIVPFGYPFSDMKYLQSGVDVIESVMIDYGMEYFVMDTPGASSDMGNVSYRCPSFHPSVAITDEDLALHSKAFADVVISEKSKPCIINGATVIDGFLARILEDPEKLKAIREEFDRM
ncbi:amidohydrolase [Anaerosphaera aminiphila DSM 21120]|uniref:Peptidase M20 domain-containing protein 2 n=1 Tax=Anaerosphaera aminiphila DSM 21120 TaxID=1120995 RepID=A0A1M5UXV3_9FIRM|nr:M20/M25/M40 family metallo-hydrolase [Anaerosphaera aminiphila]SHH67877.1 amidohydrolase [Anaerosphaera aminiphila DSM 21120]